MRSASLLTRPLCSKQLHRTFKMSSVQKVEGEQTTSDTTSPGILSRILKGQKGDEGSQVHVAHSTVLSTKEHIFELITHDTRPGELKNYLVNYENYVNLLQSKDPTSSLLGSWTVIIGKQNQAVHLWRYEDGFEGVDRRIQFLISDKDIQKCNDEHEILCTRRRNMLMLAFSFWGEPKPREPSHIYEMRSYALKPGTIIEWKNNWQKGIKFRRSYNQDVAGFFSQIGRLYEVHHFWAYKSMEDRMRIREETWSEPGWDINVQYTVPLIKRMQSRIMVPTQFSLLK